MSRKRIQRIIEIQEKRLEMEREAREKQLKEAEQKARNAGKHNNSGRGSQRIPIN